MGLLHTWGLQLKMLRLTLVLVLIACVGQIIGVPLNQAHQNELKAFKAMLQKSEKAKKTEGTNESRVGPGGEPPKFMSVEGWKDCMESKDMGSWGAWCLPAQKPKSNKCLEKSWKERSRVVAQMLVLVMMMLVQVMKVMKVMEAGNKREKRIKEMTLEMDLRQSPIGMVPGIGKVVETTRTQMLVLVMQVMNLLKILNNRREAGSKREMRFHVIKHHAKTTGLASTIQRGSYVNVLLGGQAKHVKKVTKSRRQKRKRFGQDMGHLKKAHGQRLGKEEMTLVR